MFSYHVHRWFRARVYGGFSVIAGNDFQCLIFQKLSKEQLILEKLPATRITDWFWVKS